MYKIVIDPITLCILHRKSLKCHSIQVFRYCHVHVCLRLQEPSTWYYLFSLVAWQSAMARGLQYLAPSKIIDV